MLSFNFPKVSQGFSNRLTTFELSASSLQLWNHGHREAGCVQRGSVLRVREVSWHQPHRDSGRLGSRKWNRILDCAQLLGRAVGESWQCLSSAWFTGFLYKLAAGLKYSWCFLIYNPRDLAFSLFLPGWEGLAQDCDKRLRRRKWKPV